MEPGSRPGEYGYSLSGVSGCWASAAKARQPRAAGRSLRMGRGEGRKGASLDRWAWRGVTKYFITPQAHFAPYTRFHGNSPPRPAIRRARDPRRRVRWWRWGRLQPARRHDAAA